MLQDLIEISFHKWSANCTCFTYSFKQMPVDLGFTWSVRILSRPQGQGSKVKDPGNEVDF